MPPALSPARPEPVELRPAPAPAGGSRGHILMVDDDPFTTLVLDHRLRALGYTLTLACGPTEAETALVLGEYDLILSDVHMPGNHHLEWTESLLARHCPAPILLMTGNPALETACRAANLPVAGYLIKPPDWETLDARLQQAIHSHRRRSDFVGLAREILDLIESSPGPHDEILIQRLATLASGFLAETGRPPLADNVTSGDFRWRAALAETVAVIEKTRHSFRSKELGQLRLRLEKMLGQSASPAEPLTAKAASPR